MDAATLTSLVIGLLTPIATSTIHNWTRESYQQSRRLYEALRNRFAKEADGGKVANKALQMFLDNPSYSSKVEEKLFCLLQTDPAFADTLRQIIAAGPRQKLTTEEETGARRLEMANTLDIARQEIKVRKYSTVNDVQIRFSVE